MSDAISESAISDETIGDEAKEFLAKAIGIIGAMSASEHNYSAYLALRKMVPWTGRQEGTLAEAFDAFHSAIRSQFNNYSYTLPLQCWRNAAIALSTIDEDGYASSFERCRVAYVRKMADRETARFELSADKCRLLDPSRSPRPASALVHFVENGAKVTSSRPNLSFHLSSLARLPGSETAAIDALRALDGLRMLSKCKQPDTTYDLASEVALKLAEYLRVTHRSKWPQAVALAAEAIAAIGRLPSGEPAERTKEEMAYVSAMLHYEATRPAKPDPIAADPTRGPAWKLMCGG